MKTIIILFLFATLSLAENPRVYSSLGDTIYNNVDSISKLKDIGTFSYKKDKIENYVKEVEKNRELGFLIESGKSKEKGLYLKKLRELIEINNQYVKYVYINFKGAVKAEDSPLFIDLVNSGLLDTKKHKSEIINYYTSHTNEVEKSGVIAEVLAEEEVIKKRRAARTLTHKQKEAKKIKRIKARDKAKADAIAKSLEEELLKQKRDIRANQARELLKN